MQCTRSRQLVTESLIYLLSIQFSVQTDLISVAAKKLNQTDIVWRLEAVFIIKFQKFIFTTQKQPKKYIKKIFFGVLTSEIQGVNILLQSYWRSQAVMCICKVFRHYISSILIAHNSTRVAISAPTNINTVL